MNARTHAGARTHNTALARAGPRQQQHPPPLPPARPHQNPDSEVARKKAEAERLRAAEKFMVIGSGTAQCKGCG
jgi:hypothetical protein